MFALLDIESRRVSNDDLLTAVLVLIIILIVLTILFVFTNRRLP